MKGIGATVGEFLAGTDTPFKRVLTLHEEDFVDAMTRERGEVVRRVPLQHYVDWKSIVPFAPPRSSVERWRSDAKQYAVSMWPRSTPSLRVTPCHETTGSCTCHRVG